MPHDLFHIINGFINSASCSRDFCSILPPILINCLILTFMFEILMSGSNLLTQKISNEYNLQKIYIYLEKVCSLRSWLLNDNGLGK